MSWVAVGAAAVAAVGSVAASSISSSKSGTQTTSGGNETEKGTITTSGFSPEVMQQLQGIITSGSFSKDTAKADSKDAALGAMRDVMQQFMPDIAGATKKAGMSNGSMTQSLANQTANNAAYAGSKLQLDTINSYNNNFSQLLTTLSQGQPRTETRDIVTTSKPTVQASESGMCWITTLVCDWYGFADDCDILTTLREFRDSYMKDPEYPERNAMVAEYYASAGEYEHMLDCLSDGAKILHYSKFLHNYITPAVKAINEHRHEEALALYTAMFNDVKELHVSVTQH